MTSILAIVLFAMARRRHAAVEGVAGLEPVSESNRRLVQPRPTPENVAKIENRRVENVKERQTDPDRGLTAGPRGSKQMLAIPKETRK
ncbi:hypothetical protein BD309DRAFT_966720 [Dichomitus squalens]|nr:hypothetical protein BD309DRAFT_966720 [Dichomitus squalens]